MNGTQSGRRMKRAIETKRRLLPKEILVRRKRDVPLRTLGALAALCGHTATERIRVSTREEGEWVIVETVSQLLRFRLPEEDDEDEEEEEEGGKGDDAAAPAPGGAAAAADAYYPPVSLSSAGRSTATGRVYTPTGAEVMSA